MKQEQKDHLEEGDEIIGGSSESDSPSTSDGEEEYTSSDDDPVVSSDYEDEDDNVLADRDTNEIDEAVLDYVQTLNTHSHQQNPPADEEDGDRPETVEESDSSEDEVPSRNTVGDVPLNWYKDEQHIGYDIGGKKIKKQPKKDQLDSFLAQADDSKDW